MLREEYEYLKSRIEKINKLISRIKVANRMAEISKIEINTPIEILIEQRKIMQEYLDILEQRMIIEGIEEDNINSNNNEGKKYEYIV